MKRVIVKVISIFFLAAVFYSASLFLTHGVSSDATVESVVSFLVPSGSKAFTVLSTAKGVKRVDRMYTSDGEVNTVYYTPSKTSAEELAALLQERNMFLQTLAEPVEKDFE